MKKIFLFFVICSGTMHASKADLEALYNAMLVKPISFHLIKSSSLLKSFFERDWRYRALRGKQFDYFATEPGINDALLHAQASGDEKRLCKARRAESEADQKAFRRADRQLRLQQAIALSLVPPEIEYAMAVKTVRMQIQDKLNSHELYLKA